MTVLEELLGIRQQNHREAMTIAQVGNMIENNNEALHTKRRLDAQLDSLLKSKCRDYEPPERDMGHTFLNSPIIGDDALRGLEAAISAEARSNAGTDPRPMQPAPTQQPAANNQAPTQSPAQRDESSSFWSWLKNAFLKMLPLLLTAGIAIAAARYFAPADTDTTNEFSIKARPYIPPERQ